MIEQIERDCLLVIDEIDSLMNILSENIIIELNHKTRLKIVGISNDHDITNNYFNQNRERVEMIEFKAYNSTQL